MNENSPLFLAATHASAPIRPWQWGRLGIDAAWQCIDQGESQVTVAVIDTGIAHNHIDLVPHLLPAKAISLFHPDTRDDDDHGTAIAGTIAAFTQEPKDSSGNQRVKILPVKFCSQQFVPNADLGAQAVNLALDQRQVGIPMVIMLAWDCGFNTVALRNAISRAGTLGVTVVTAAGNQGINDDLYPNWPANYGTEEHVITVMATDIDNTKEGYNGGWINQRASFSSFGETAVNLAAPGVDILSTVPYCTGPVASKAVQIGYRIHSGTSGAAAHVAGLVSLILLKHPTATPGEIKRHLRAAARPVASLKPVSRPQWNSERVPPGTAVCGPISEVNASTTANAPPTGLLNRAVND